MMVIVPMLECQWKILERDLRTMLLPELKGKVFHVTSEDSFTKIIQAEAIKPNTNGRFSYTFRQSANSYGSKRGYVCLFDLRDTPDDEIDLGFSKYRVLNPSHAENRPVFLFISQDIHGDLIPWATWKQENVPLEMAVPRIEAWYPREIPVCKITKVLRVEVLIDPNTIGEQIKNARKALQAR